jgi:hypothetical protein
MLRKVSFVTAAGLLAAVSLAAQNGKLKTHITPEGAGVFVDGKYMGPAGRFGVGRTYSLPPGEHKVTLAEPRYEDFSTTVTIQSGKTTSVMEKMKALPVPQGPFGMLRIKHADILAAVYINEKFMGHADEFNNPWQALKLPAGEYELKIVPTSGQPTTQKIKIEAEKTLVIK